MDDLENLLGKVKTGLCALQEVQELYDSDLWAIQDPPFAKFRHIVIHINILAGALSQLCEQWEHQSIAGESSRIEIASKAENIAPRIADLLIHASQLANIASQGLYPCLVNRFEANARRFSPTSEFSQLTHPK